MKTVGFFFDWLIVWVFWFVCLFFFSLRDLFILSNCAFLAFFKGLIHFLFKDLYYLHIGAFKVFCVYFNYTGIFRTCWGRKVGLYRRNIVLAVLIVFILASRYLGSE